MTWRFQPKPRPSCWSHWPTFAQPERRTAQDCARPQCGAVISAPFDSATQRGVPVNPSAGVSGTATRRYPYFHAHKQRVKTVKTVDALVLVPYIGRLFFRKRLAQMI